MARDKELKTNVSRLLTQKKVPHTLHGYDAEDGAIDGVSVAKKMGEDPDCVFKTLVTVGHSGQHYVFVVPVAATLDLKKAAAASREKSIVMIQQKDLLPLTGYIHGGCSPVGMKKPFPTWIHKSAEPLAHMFVSAGKIGCQCEIAPKDLAAFVGASFADLCAE